MMLTRIDRQGFLASRGASGHRGPGTCPRSPDLGSDSKNSAGKHRSAAATHWLLRLFV